MRSIRGEEMTADKVDTRGGNGDAVLFSTDGSLPVEDGNRSGGVVRLAPSQIDDLATVLSRAFCEECSARYVLPNENSRLRLLQGFFRNVIFYSQIDGDVYTTPNVDGGALWIPSATELTIPYRMRAQFTSRPFQWGRANLKRWTNLRSYLDRVRGQLVQGSHWYLLAVGVEPSARRRKIGGALIEPLLSRADSDGLPCYLETFNANYMAFFKRHGFRTIGGGRIPGGGPEFWVMMRSPQMRG